MFYVLRASELGPSVKGISLPNMDELINVQFADDTSLFLGLTEKILTMPLGGWISFVRLLDPK